MGWNDLMDIDGIIYLLNQSGKVIIQFEAENKELSNQLKEALTQVQALLQENKLLKKSKDDED